MKDEIKVQYETMFFCMRQCFLHETVSFCLAHCCALFLGHLGIDIEIQISILGEIIWMGNQLVVMVMAVTVIIVMMVMMIWERSFSLLGSEKGPYLKFNQTLYGIR